MKNEENAPTEVFQTSKKGLGLRSKAKIKDETFIMELLGEVINENQFLSRVKKYSKENAQHFYFMALSSENFIDATYKGNLSRFINHSCDPNAEIQKVQTLFRAGGTY